MTPEYAAAIEAHNEALRAYDPIRDGFRAGTISTETFLIARAVKIAADAAFDVAYAKESA